jgi:hypothetical protein
MPLLLLADLTPLDSLNLLSYRIDLLHNERAEHRKRRRSLKPNGLKGGAESGALEVAPDVWVYQITKNGLALQATLQGTKYYKDDDLNKKS